MFRDALVVGINTYRGEGLQNLRSPASDAEAIAQKLQSCGEFRIWRLPEFLDPFEENARRVAHNQEVTLAQLEEALVQLFKPEGQHFPDTALFFFSGHGLRKQRGIQEGYLATSDANPEQGNWGLSLQWLRRLLQESPVRQQIVWIDCCYSGELFNFAEADPGDLGKGRDRCFIAASREYEVAYEETTGKHSVLTQALLNGLDPKQHVDGEVSNFTLVDFLNRGLKDATQRPIYANSGGKIILTGSAAQTVSELAESVCPYKGLSYFDCNGEDPKYFYGRTALTDRLIEKVREGNFLAVLGASGSGKSSLVRAGLLHQLKQGQRLSGSDRWPIYIFRPGEHPLQSLAWAFVDPDVAEVERASQLAKATELVESGAVGLGHLVTAAAGEGRAILAIDQFEEVFALCRDETERQQLFECLIGVLNRVGQKLCLVIALRADFFGKCAEQEYAGLANKLQEDLVTVTPMTPEELEDAIIEPAKQVGLEVERELVDRILEDVEGPGSLPLLQYTLTELWKQRTVNRLTLTEYTRLGGVKGTLKKRAEAVYQSLSQPEQRIAQRIFLELTQLGEGTEDTRRRVFKRNLVTSPGSEALVARVIQQLADAKLVVTSEVVEKSADSQRLAIVDVAHEALIRHWPRLRTWIDENRARLRVQRQIEQEAKLWWQHEQETSYLWQGVRLAQAEEIYQNYKDELSREVEAFIEAGLARRQQEQLQEKRRLRRTLMAAAAIAILGLAALGSGGAAYWKGRIAQQNEIKALNSLSQAKLASHEQLEALVASVKAGKQLQELGRFGVPKELRSETTQGLLHVIDEIQEQNQLDGHTAGVTDVAFSPDGQTLASASARGTIKLWSADGAERVTFRGHGSDIIFSIRFSPDGQTLASSGSDKTIRLWNLKGKELATLEGHDDAVIDVNFSPDGQILASASDDGTVKLWNLDGTQIATLEGHDGEVTSVSFSPSGQMLASASYDRTIRLWNRNGQNLRVLTGHQGEVISVRFSPNGQTLASASTDKTVRLWSLDGQALRVFPHESWVNDVSFSPDGQTIASAGEEQVARVWRLDGELLEVLEGHEAPINSIRFSPNGRLIATASADEDVKLWTLDKPQLLHLQKTLHGHNKAVSRVSFSPSRQLFASASTDTTIKLWRLDGEAISTLQGHDEMVNEVEFSPDGKLLVSSSQDRTVKFWNPDGQLVRTFEVNDIVNDVSFSPNGQTIALASDDRTIKLWQRNGEEIRLLSGHNSPVYGVSFSPKGDMLASVGEDATVRLWNADGQLLKTLLGHSARTLNVSFSPDGQTIASASNDRTIKLWNLEGKLLNTLEGHNRAVFDVIFSPDGQLLASAGFDNTIKIWDFNRGEIIQELEGHDQGIFDLDFHPNNQTLASASFDNTIRLWSLTSSPLPSARLENLLSYSCSWLGDYLTNNVQLDESDRRLCN